MPKPNAGPIVATMAAASLLPWGVWQTNFAQPVPSFARFAATEEDFTPSWSPDGRQIVFARRQQRGTHLFVVSASGGPARPLLNLPDDDHIYTQPDWSRTGRVAFSSNRGGRSQIWTMNIDGTDARQITDLPGSPNVQPRWSPDGTQIAFVAYPGPRVMLVSASGGEPRRIAAGVWPAWSPDGKRIAYGGTDFVGIVNRLAIADLETGAETSLKSAPPISPSQQPDWSPDGRRLLCIATIDGVPRVQVLDITADRLESTTDGRASLYNPHWSPDGSRIVFMATDTAHSPSIQTARPDGSDVRALTTRTSYTQAQSITYRSEDGVAIPSYLFEPARCAAAKCAAIVWLHGGLGTLFGNAFDKQVQYFVDQGFVVLAPNYRSSGGYGTEIAAVDATGRTEMEDVVAAADYLRKRPTVDASRLGVMGFSFGGLIALFTAVHRPGVFNAVVDVYGPTDLTRWYRDSPTSRPALRFGLGGTPDEKPDAYHDASPVTAAERAVAPTLIVHGDADTDVPVSQAIEMSDALHAAHKEVELVVIPRGDHGFVASGLTQAMETAMRFLLANLQPRTAGPPIFVRPQSPRPVR